MILVERSLRGFLEDRHPLGNFLYLLILSLFVVTLLLGIFSVKKRKSTELKKEGKEEKKKSKINPSVLKMLTKQEKEIIELMEASAEEEITQAYIYKTLGIPKSSLSDIIKKLEQRDLIEKKREGRINWIKLKKWVFD